MGADVTGTLLVSSAVSGAAGSLVTLLATKGVDWLIDLVATHSPAVKAKSQENMQNFLYRLAERVVRLEHEMPVGADSIFENAMEHPGTAFLISSAMKHSAITDCDEHHALLTEIIAQRLGAGANDMVTLAGTAACDVINFLSARQIHLLANLALIFDIRPLQKVVLQKKKTRIGRSV